MSGRRGEAGSALVEVTWLAILLLVPLVYVVVGVFEVQRAAFASTAAARAAGRAFVLAADPAEAQQRARAAAAVAMSDQGVDGGAVVIGCRPACLVPGSVVEVQVSYQVPLPFLPDALGRQAPSIRVHAEHTVPYGSFREDRS
ncbi:hypothetical protein [Nocardioides mesophilus]|uniref:Pilus assembly protein n=1 Tax=Nocardioides mesophilus TaxID=433659 RepID=A0A7G9RD80_9ACTN|nr:hypothetical protein [Nocardioides mesophilus]QNN53555.1 hypothetical protein H9L09_03765 [Nocardioides mesophilus]